MASSHRHAEQALALTELHDARDAVLPGKVASARGHRDYLCERILTVGSNLLADEDILEFLLFTVSPGRARLLADALLSRFGSFARAIGAPAWDLLSVEGLGVAGAAPLKTVDWAALRKVRAEVINKPVLGSWGRLMAYLHAELSRERVEQFRVLFLNARSRLLADELLATGTVDHVWGYSRNVAKRALELSATAVILVHNKTSGDPVPSPEDIAMTEQIGKAVTALSVKLIDHIVVGDGRMLSFRKEGLLSQTRASENLIPERQIPRLGYISESPNTIAPTSFKMRAAASRSTSRTFISQSASKPAPSPGQLSPRSRKPPAKKRK